MINLKIIPYGNHKIIYCFSSGAWINREFIEKGTSRALTPDVLSYLREKSIGILVSS